MNESYDYVEKDESDEEIARLKARIVELEAANRVLERRNMQTRKLETLGIVVGGIAHDFNNLLMGILGNTDLALSQLETDSPVRRDIERIRKAAAQGANLVMQMMEYSRKVGSSTVKTDSSMEPHDLS